MTIIQFTPIFFSICFAFFMYHIKSSKNEFIIFLKAFRDTDLISEQTYKHYFNAHQSPFGLLEIFNLPTESLLLGDDKFEKYRLFVIRHNKKLKFYAYALPILVISMFLMTLFEQPS